MVAFICEDYLRACVGLSFALILSISFPKQDRVPFLVAVPANNAIPGDTAVIDAFEGCFSKCSSPLCV
jgi:hypothetical protein